jgi:hypothetical protein
MIHLFKKLYQSLVNPPKQLSSVNEVELLKQEIKRLQEEHEIFLIFCKNSVMPKMQKMEYVIKGLSDTDTQINEINQLINQHATTINGFLENYKKHVLNPDAHMAIDSEDDDYIDSGKKQRNDN